MRNDNYIATWADNALLWNARMAERRERLQSPETQQRDILHRVRQQQRLRGMTGAPQS